MHTLHNEIVEEARTYKNVPWRHQGRTKHGIDCAGLVLRVGQRFDLIAPDFDVKGYARRPNGFSFLSAFRAVMVEKPLHDAAPGDAIVFIDGPYPCHCGIITHGKNDVLYFVHAYAGARKVMEQPYIDDWKHKATHCFAYKDIE